MKLMSQGEADAFWAAREVKKWVVVLQAPKRRVNGVSVAKSIEAYVAARTRDRAISCAIANVPHERWTRVTARLATAQDLGCVHVASATR